MSSFAFVLVTIAAVPAFAISEILAGWGRMLRDRRLDAVLDTAAR